MRIATRLSGMTGFLTAVWFWPGVSVAAKLLLPMVPLGDAVAFILSGPHAVDVQMVAVPSAGGVLSAFWS